MAEMTIPGMKSGKFGYSICLKPHLFRGSSFRDIEMGDPALIPLPCDIKVAVAASILLKVIFPVHTGADYV